jgi:hypothetical protein
MCENCDCLASVPSETIFFEDKKGASTCVICMDFIGDNNKTILSCGHEFHANCFAENVINANNTCPLCRTEVCKKADVLPNLTKTMTASFMESILNTPGGQTNVKNYVFQVCKQLGGWDKLKLNEQYDICRETIKLLMNFGFSLGGSIRAWIEEGNSRYQESVDDFTVQINMQELVNNVNIMIQEENDTEEELCSLTPLFNEEDMKEYELEEGEMAEEYDSREQEAASTIQFLYDYDLTAYLPRIMANEELKYLTELLNADIDSIMWPSGGPGHRPLFTREEAEDIFGGILRYFGDQIYG